MRSNENKLVVVPFTQGVNEAFNQFAAPAGTLVTCRNMRIREAGVLEKRRRMTGIGAVMPDSSHGILGDATTSWVETPCFCTEVGDALLVGTTGGEAFARTATLATGLWAFQGCFSTCLPVQKRYGLVTEQADFGFGASPPATAVNSDGYLMVAAVEATGQLHAFIEDPNGVRVWYYVGTSQVVARVQVVAVDDDFFLVFQRDLDVSAQQVTPGATGVTIGTLTSIATIDTADDYWDTSTDGSSRWWLVYTVPFTPPIVLHGIVVQRMSGITVADSTQWDGLGVAPAPLSACYIAPLDQLFIGYYDEGSVGYRVLDPDTLDVIQTDTEIANAPDIYGPPVFGYLHQYNNVLGAATRVVYAFRYVLGTGHETRALYAGLASNDGSAPDAPTAVWHTLPISKFDNYGRIWVVQDNNATGVGDGAGGDNSDGLRFQQVMLLRVLDPSFLGRPIIELSAPLMERITEDYSPAADPGYFHAIATGEASSFYAFPFALTRVGDTPLVKVEVYEYTTGEQEPHRHTLKLGPRTVVAGQPVEFWGQGVGQRDDAGTAITSRRGGATEVGFPQIPAIVETATTSPPGPGPGNYKYRVVFEWVDLYGRLHRSIPSAEVLVELASAQQVNLSLTTLDIGQRQTNNTETPVRIHVYRTLAGGEVYQRLPSYLTASDSADGVVTFSDVYPDADVDENAFLYTDGGVIPNALAPSCRFLCAAEDRVWFGGLWDPTLIQCSKVMVPGEPLQCAEDPTHQVVLPGKCTGLAYMDGTVVAFTKDAVYLVQGQGPNDQGAGEFQPPRMLTRDVGCVDYRSIVETKLGIFFQSRMGLYLIPRGFGAPDFVGAPVRSTVAANDVFLGSSVLASGGHHLARWLLAASGNSGTTLVTYDLSSQQWFTDTVSQSMAELGSSAEADGFVLVRSLLNSGTVTRPVWVESDAQGGDDQSTYVSGVVKTAWIYPFGQGGWGKINKLLVAFLAEDDCTITCTVQVDANTIETKPWTITGSAALQYRQVDLKNRDGSAVQVQLTDTANGGDFGGFKPVSMTFEVDPSGGIRLLASGEKS